MADYTTPSGAGQLMIRDNGSTVEFWMYTPYRLYWNNLRFSADANGTTYNFSINYQGSGYWAKVGEIGINNDQRINFNLLDRTGTSSIAGPTSMSADIYRGQPPSKPPPPSVIGVGSSNVVLTYNDPYDGGKPLDVRQLGWGTNPGGATYTIWGGRTFDIQGLQKGTTYYFWSQAHNEKGWGEWSDPTFAITTKEPNAPTVRGVRDISQVSFTYEFDWNGDNGAPVDIWQVGWGTNPNSPTNFVDSYGGNTITGLSPATTYYVWARGHNNVGWGPWSIRTQIKTLAGAQVRVDGVYRDAIPYVKFEGVWRLARPWSKQAGNWKETQ